MVSLKIELYELRMNVIMPLGIYMKHNVSYEHCSAMIYVFTDCLFSVDLGFIRDKPDLFPDSLVVTAKFDPLPQTKPHSD